jgi:putative addiction module killer protein
VINTILRTAEFDAWFSRLKDVRGKARIMERIRCVERGNSGDCAPVGEGVSEMRIHTGPGYRVYFARKGKVIYILLCAGIKSGQQRDIVRAKVLARLLRRIKQ